MLEPTGSRSACVLSPRPRRALPGFAVSGLRGVRVAEPREGTDVYDAPCWDPRTKLTTGCLDVKKASGMIATPAPLPDRDTAWLRQTRLDRVRKVPGCSKRFRGNVPLK